MKSLRALALALVTIGLMACPPVAPECGSNALCDRGGDAGPDNGDGGAPDAGLLSCEELDIAFGDAVGAALAADRNSRQCPGGVDDCAALAPTLECDDGSLIELCDFAAASAWVASDYAAALDDIEAELCGTSEPMCRGGGSCAPTQLACDTSTAADGLCVLRATPP